MPVNGSSSRMILGLETSARAISSRRRSPPESERATDFRSRLMSKLVQQLVAAGLAGLAVHAQQLHHAQQVLLHGELAEDARLLGQVAHAAFAGAAIHGPAGDVHVVEDDAAGVGLDHAAGHAEAGRLAGAVGPQQADDLALIDAEIDAVDDAPRAVVFHQSLDFKHGNRSVFGCGWHVLSLDHCNYVEQLQARCHLYRTRCILPKLGIGLMYGTSGTFPAEPASRAASR